VAGGGLLRGSESPRSGGRVPGGVLWPSCGGTVPAAVNPMRECEPSQSGLRNEAPRRQRKNEVGRGDVGPMNMCITMQICPIRWNTVRRRDRLARRRRIAWPSP
jgi:hypothetical protein